MILGPFQVFQSYQDDGQMIMKSCVQWNPVYGWEEFALTGCQTPDRQISRQELNPLSYQGSFLDIKQATECIVLPDYALSQTKTRNNVYTTIVDRKSNALCLALQLFQMVTQIL